MKHHSGLEDLSNDLPQLTTTEELIVQYLDGELIRHELEAVLFERLAQSSDARTLLREYLLMRGAIKTSMDADAFQLSAELDSRTRVRIEHVLQTIALEVPVGELPVRQFAPDALPVATNATTRRLRTRRLRPALALLALLLTISTTWYVTRTQTLNSELASNTHSNTDQPSANSQQQQLDQGNAVEPNQELPSAPSTVATKDISPAAETPTISTREIIRYKYRDRPVAANKTSGSMSNAFAQNSATPPAVVSAPVVKSGESTPTADPADIMISHRYAKLLNETVKHEVVVTSHDRL